MSEGIVIALIGLIGSLLTALIEAITTLAAIKLQQTNGQASTTTTRRLIFISRIPRSLIRLFL